jgi:hypothetical protein
MPIPNSQFPFPIPILQCSFPNFSILVLRNCWICWLLLGRNDFAQWILIFGSDFVKFGFYWKVPNFRWRLIAYRVNCRNFGNFSKWIWEPFMISKYLKFLTWIQNFEIIFFCHF